MRGLPGAAEHEKSRFRNCKKPLRKAEELLCSVAVNIPVRRILPTPLAFNSSRAWAAHHGVCLKLSSGAQKHSSTHDSKCFGDEEFSPPPWPSAAAMRGLSRAAHPPRQTLSALVRSRWHRRAGRPPFRPQSHPWPPDPVWGAPEQREGLDFGFSVSWV